MGGRRGGGFRISSSPLREGGGLPNFLKPPSRKGGGLANFLKHHSRVLRIFSSPLREFFLQPPFKPLLKPPLNSNLRKPPFSSPPSSPFSSLHCSPPPPPGPPDQFEFEEAPLAQAPFAKLVRTMPLHYQTLEHMSRLDSPSVLLFNSESKSLTRQGSHMAPFVRIVHSLDAMYFQWNGSGWFLSWLSC